MSPEPQKGIEASKPILERFNRDKIIPAPFEDYVGLGQLLVPVWGFH